MSWTRVTPSKPCPVCGKDSWCSVAQDGSLVCCMRVESEWRCKAEAGGWIHQISPTIGQRVRNVFRRSPKEHRQYKSPAYWHRIVVDAIEREPSETLVPLLARRLGVSRDALSELLVGTIATKEGNAWTFPMFDGKGALCGVRIRGYGGKWSVKHSHNGLFWPIKVDRYRDSLLFIAEGPTDTAALLDLGFDAIGRPDAQGGVNQLTEFLQPSNRDVVIMADNDENGVGRAGAIKLAAQIKDLAGSVSVLKPPKRYKDIRAWYNAGATRADILKIMEGSR